MDKNELRKYVDCFEYTYPNTTGISEIFVLNRDTDDNLLKILIDNAASYIENNTTAVGVVRLGHIENCGALQSGARILRIQKQSGYAQESYWKNEISSWFLGKKETNFEWKTILLPIFNNLQRSLDPTYQKNTIILSAPSIADNMEYPCWKQIFEKIMLKPVKIIICDAGMELVKSKSFMGRNYVVSSTDASVTVAAYDRSNMQDVRFVGCQSFECGHTVTNMKNVQYKIIDINILSTEYKTEQIESSVLSWNPIEPLLEKTSVSKEFLERNTAFFGKEYYALTDGFDLNKHTDLEKSIYKLINEYGSLCAEDVCENICERSLHNISLADLVTIAFSLEKSSLFKKTTLKTKRDKLLSTMNITVYKKKLDSIEMIPANYYHVEWKLKNPSGFIGSYHKLNADRFKFDMLISVIVEHFSNPTTYTVAEELLAFYKFAGDPTAYFTAKVFLYLSGDKRFLQANRSGR